MVRSSQLKTEIPEKNANAVRGSWNSFTFFRKILTKILGLWGKKNLPEENTFTEGKHSPEEDTFTGGDYIHRRRIHSPEEITFTGEEYIHCRRLPSPEENTFTRENYLHRRRIRSPEKNTFTGGEQIYSWLLGGNLKMKLLNKLVFFVLF